MPLSFTGPESFYSADEEAWWASVDKALKGASRQRLFGATDDGLDIAPLYDRRTGTPARSLRTMDQDWSIVQRIEIPDAVQANAQILEDLEGGANGIELVFPEAATAHGYGIQAGDLVGLEQLLDGVQPGLINIRLEAGSQSAEALALMLSWLKKRNIDPASVNLTCGIDPYAQTAAQETATAGSVSAIRQLQDTVKAVHDLGSPARVMMADGRPWHNAGATPALELALVLASAAAHLRTLEDAGIEPEHWASRISMTLVADADQFGTIAKARAIRALWSCVLEGAGLSQSPMPLHMCTSYRMLTKRDPWVNLLRNTVAVFAAGIGGADSVCVLPHTLAAGLPDGFARRLARNTQSILLEESNLSKVMDPSAGSGAIEDRTDKLCGAAWGYFQEIEAAGGIFEAVQRGLVRNHIGAARSELDKNVARRKRPITGVSEFPDLSETDVTVLQSESGTKATAPLLNDLPEPDGGQRFNALCRSALSGNALLDLAARPAQQESGRIAEPFERLRATADAFENSTAHAPKVFLASLGTLAQFTARAGWTANAFAAGGIQAVGPAVYNSLDELVAAFKESGAVLACLVSSDDVYADEAESAARLLKEAGAAHLYLAGKPGSSETGYTEAGVDAFLYAGCNLLELLEDAHARLNEAQGAPQSGQEVLK